jgi:PAS domain S-box-containing protein
MGVVSPPGFSGGSLNLNKLFPRLTIRSKLTIAFVLLAAIPLLAVAGFATRVKVDQLRDTAKSALDHDVAMARTQVEQALREAAENVAYLARSVLSSALVDPTPSALAEVGRLASSFMGFKGSLFQVKLIDGDGALLLVARASGSELVSANGQASGMYYAYRAQSLEPGGQLLLPVELSGRDVGVVEGTIPAVAIVMALWSPAGVFRGAVVGEAYASSLFVALESGSPNLPGVTGLVDQEGFFLYHTDRKRDWSSLLAERAVVDLPREFSPDLAAEIMAGSVGTLTADRKIVSYAPLSLASYGTGPLYLYRTVPLSTLEAPVRRFMVWVGAVGVVVAALVLALAVVAANQFTRPIYQLREAMRQLAAGEPSPALAITTNDELEDLAGEFSGMATSLTTYRHRLEELVAERTRALHETYGELASVLAHTTDAIIGLDVRGRVRVWNRGAESLFGYEAAEVTGRPLDELLRVPGRGAGREAAYLERKLAEEGSVVDFRTERVDRSGHTIPVSLSQSVIRDEAGQPLGYSLILRDATLQSRLEEQMRRSERLAAASVMATALAHEVNNPLAIIGNRIECMEREVRTMCPDCDLELDLSVLREHTDRLMGVTRDLLGLARDDTDLGGEVELRTLVKRVARLVEQTFTARDLHLEVVATPEPVPVQGSENALETVVLNLMLNAADATPADGTVTVELRLAREGVEVEVEVRDTGHGVPVELRERIFEPFFTTKGPRGGTGLGLAVCRTVLERHGGRIRVESEDGAGSRFIMALPIHAGVPV